MEVIEIDKISEITRLFYDEHLRPTDIAKQIGVSKSYVTKIIQKDERYIKEKEYRSTQSRERHKVCKRNYINKKRQADKQEYQSMIIQINKDNEYLFIYACMPFVRINQYSRLTLLSLVRITKFSRFE